MAEGIVQVTEGSGKKLHTWNRTIGANSVEDEFVLPGEFPYASYFVTPSAASTATLNSHLLQIMAGGSLPVRIRRIVLTQFTNATTAAAMAFHIFRLTTAGTGGTTVTPRPHDTTDAAAGCVGMTLPTVKGTEGVQLFDESMLMRQAILATASQNIERWTWEQHPGTKPIIIPAGTTNGIAIKNATAVAGATVQIRVELVETSFV